MLEVLEDARKQAITSRREFELCMARAVAAADSRDVGVEELMAISGGTPSTTASHADDPMAPPTPSTTH